MRLEIAAVLCGGLLLSGCAQQVAYAPPARPVARTNIIIGHAEIDQGGKVATCAGDAATLLPVTHTTSARIEELYPNGDYTPVNAGTHVARNPAIDRMARHAACDPLGNFRFAGVPDGSYYLIAGVRGAERGSVKREISVHGGVTRHVVLGG